tara:strand:+ start:6012 stop:6539 length:528 start_codon:yes stop_codon:yes gene_type:complete
MKKILGIFGVIAVVACAPAHAGSTVVYGKVTNVQPVYTQVVNQTPQQVCKQVQVPVYSNTGKTNNGNAILGAIIGGVIGNQFGKGDGNKAATAVGAAIGAVKGSQTGQGKQIVGYQMVNQCHTEYNSSTKSVVNEYDVTYNVNGTIIKMRVNRAVGNNMYVGKQQKFRINYQMIN